MNDFNNMPYFIFNNIKSTDLGIIIKEMPPITKSEKDIDIIDVSGRNGNLHIDNGTYKSKRYKITCIMMDDTKINQIKSLLDGAGILELSSEPNIEYKAIVLNQIDFSKYLKYLKEFSITFELDPIAYSKTLISQTFSNQNNSFNVGGTYNVSPILTIDGTGIIVLNNKKIEVLESGITIDCELMNCTKNNLNKNDKVNLDEFPTLLVGNNNLTLETGINSVILSYKEGWL